MAADGSATLVDTKKGLEDLEKGSDGAQSALDRLQGLLKGDVKGALEGVTEGFGAAAIAGVGLGVAAFELADKFGDTFNALQNLHISTGLSVGTLASWKDTAAVTGVSADTMSTAMQRLGAGIETASQKTVDGARMLGIPFEELKAAGPEERLRLISEGVARVGTESDAAQAAVKELFGKAGLGLLPALSQEAVEYRERIHGLVTSILGDEATAASQAKDWKESVNTVEVAFESVLLRIGQGIALAPKLIAAMRGSVAESLGVSGEDAQYGQDTSNMGADQYGGGAAGPSQEALAHEENKRILTRKGIFDGLDAQAPDDAAMKEYNKVIGETVVATAAATSALDGHIAKLREQDREFVEAHAGQEDIIKAHKDLTDQLITAARASESERIKTIEESEARKAHSEAVRADGEMLKLQTKLDQELSVAEGASISVMDGKIAALRSKADAEADDAVDIYARKAATGEATEADYQAYLAAVQEANAIADLSANTLMASEAAKDRALSVKFEEEGDKALSDSYAKSGTALDQQVQKLIDATEAEMRKAEADLAARIAQEGVTDDTIAAGIALAGYEQALVLALGHTIAIDQHKALAQDLGKAWSDVKTIMQDFGVSASSSLGHVIGAVDKAISVVTSFKDLYKSLGEAIPIIEKLFGAHVAGAVAATTATAGEAAVTGTAAAATDGLAASETAASTASTGFIASMALVVGELAAAAAILGIVDGLLGDPLGIFGKSQHGTQENPGGVNVIGGHGPGDITQGQYQEHFVSGPGSANAPVFSNAKYVDRQDGDPGSVPGHADGAVSFSPHLAMIHGTTSNPEIVAPLDKLRDMIGGAGGGGEHLAELRALRYEISRLPQTLGRALPGHLRAAGFGR